MKEEKKGRFLHQEWALKWFMGFDIEWKGAKFNPYHDVTESNFLELFNNPNCKFRLKPKTIQIGSRTINAPISVKPDIGTTVFACNMSSEEKYTEHAWLDSEYHNRLFSNNMLHLQPADAINMADAVLELLKVTIK